MSAVRGKTVLSFALAVAVFTLWLGSYGLVETSDARYAEIALEMHRSGDYLTPHLFGLRHFHKPPLIYWLSALGYASLGENEWGARACQAVLGTLLAAIVWRFARRHMGEGAADWSVLCLATTPAVIGGSRMVTTDLLLTVCLTLAFSSWYDVWSGKGGWLSRPALYCSLGLAFLAKGPVPWLTLLAVVAPFCIRFRRQQGSRAIPWGLLWGIPLLLAISLPWYLLEMLRTPHLLPYFAGAQLLGRLHETGMGHPRPWYYFAFVFPLLGLPWLLFVPRGWRNQKSQSPPLADFLLLWALAPALCFSFPSTKLPLYILPAFPAVSILAGRALSGDGPFPRAALAGTAVILAILGVAMIGMGWGFVPALGRDATDITESCRRVLLLPAGCLLLVTALTTSLSLRRRGRFGAVAVAVGLALAAMWGFSRHECLPFRSTRTVGLAAARSAGAGVPLVAYRDFPSGLPFYAGRIPLLCQVERETQFDTAKATRRLLEERRFRRLWTGHRRILVVTVTRHLAGLPGARVIARGGGFVLASNR